MQVSFSIPGKVFSINKASYRDARFKTIEYKAWAHNTLQQLHKIPELASLKELFKNNNFIFSIHMAAEYPKHVYYNAQKQISSKTVDVTNFEKLFVDLLFRDVLDVNDKFIVECKSIKHHGDQYAVHISLGYELSSHQSE